MRLKTQVKPVPTEDTEQTWLFQWARLQSGKWPELSLLYAIPNGGRRPIKTAVNMKRTGTKAGVPDMFLPVARGGFHGMYIEMKRTKGGHVSDEQKSGIKALTEQGYKCVITKGWEDAAEQITAYISA